MMPSLFGRIQHAYPQASEAELLATPASAWADIVATAATFVSRERQGAHLPFALSRAGATRPLANRAVFADYFLAMPLSFHNLPTDLDSYEKNLLRPDGSDGRFARVGGYLAERPLATQVWRTPYWRQVNLVIDMLRAAEAGFDGFLVDVLRLAPEPAWSTTVALYEGAASIHRGFGIVPVIDHAALRSCTVDQVVSALRELGRQPAAYRLADGRMLVTAFAPELRSPEFWRDVVAATQAAGEPIAFIPIFLSTAEAARFLPFCYGLSTWGARDRASIAATDDKQRLSSLPGAPRIWMQPIAPQDSRPKVGGFWEAEGAETFIAGWRRALENDASFVHLITWNDYTEGTEIAPSMGIQYVFFDLSAYYSEMFHTGRPPPVTSDAIYYLLRQTIIEPAQLRSGQPFALRGDTPLHNVVECVAFLVAPATIEIEQGGAVARQPVGAGMQTFSTKARPGRPQFRIVRNSVPVVSLTSAWVIGEPAAIPRPLYIGGSSTRPNAH